jgi:hypothetical protein
MKACSLWDRVSTPYDRAIPLAGNLREHRCRARTDSLRPDDPANAEIVTPRIERWRTGFAAWNDRRGAIFWTVVAYLLRPLPAASGSFLLLWLVASIDPEFRLKSLRTFVCPASALVVVVGSGVLLNIPRQRFRRLHAALLDSRCPDCGYDLTRPPELADVCPECGSPWPLVPPEQLPPAFLRALRHPR